MKLRILFLAALIVGIIWVGLIPRTASAQTAAAEAPGFNNVTLWVYPEYDDPRLLIMLEGKITATPPIEAKFLVPSSAEMYSAGSKDAQGKYSGGPPNRVASQIAGWDEISYQVTTDTFRVEYYDTIITGQTDKQISYDFRFLSNISDLKVIVQQPLKASNFLVSPAGTQTFEDQFAVNAYSFSNPDPAKPIHFDISYTKADPKPSVQNTATPLAPLISTSNSSSSVIPILLIVVSLAAVAVFTVILIMKIRSGRAVSYATKKRRVTGVGLTREVKQTREFHKDKFCNQCGQPVGKSNRFCTSCGNKLGMMPKTSIKA